MTTKPQITQSKLKVIPGRAVTGKDIKRRLKNKTIVPGQYGEQDYTLDEEMYRFRKMSKTEQINAMKENNKKIAEMQQRLAEVADKNYQKQQQAQIEAEVNKRLAEKLKQNDKQV